MVRLHHFVKTPRNFIQVIFPSLHQANFHQATPGEWPTPTFVPYGRSDSVKFEMGLLALTYFFQNHKALNPHRSIFIKLLFVANLCLLSLHIVLHSILFHIGLTIGGEEQSFLWQKQTLFPGSFETAQKTKGR